MASNAKPGATLHEQSSEHSRAQTDIFERARPRLLGIAYRILGSRAEAEDAVQDTFLRWLVTPRGAVDSPDAWLTATCTRRAIDMLRISYRSRVDYVGYWLPEPAPTAALNDVEAQTDLASYLSTAFLLMLERLTPRERAAYLLYEVFEMPYADVAASLGLNEGACRKLVSRAKSHVSAETVRYRPSREKQEELLAAFEEAVRSGESARLATVLAADVRLTSDGGGRVPALRKILVGDAVAAFVTERLSVRWPTYKWSVTDLNGLRGIVLRDGARIVAAVTFAFNERHIKDIYIVRNPDKLSSLDTPLIH